VSHKAYDRELLRQQITRLRQAAAARSRLEHEITSEYETETTTTRQQAEAAIAALEQKYAKETDTTRREHAAVIKQTDADAAADRAKLDTQRKGFTATINRNWENQDRQLKEDSQFDEGSSKEVFKEKRAEPGKILRRAEKELASVAAQLDEADSSSLKFLADRGIAAAASEATAVDAEPLPTGSALLSLLEQLRATVVDTATKLVGLKSVATAFSGGTRAAAILLPVLLGSVFPCARHRCRRPRHQGGGSRRGAGHRGGCRRRMWALAHRPDATGRRHAGRGPAGHTCSDDRSHAAVHDGEHGLHQDPPRRSTRQARCRVCRGVETTKAQGRGGHHRGRREA
jgi:hypothetical protein